MSVEWFLNSKKLLVTIYETNITLNTVASENFKGAFTTIVGFDGENNTLLIKALTKDEASIGAYDKNDLHDISIKPSYGRISGKAIVSRLMQFYSMDFDKFPFHKFEAKWNKENNCLVVELDKEVH